MSQLVLGDDLCPAEKGFDPKGKFLGIEGFRDVIIHAGEEALLDVGRLLSGGEHEDGEVIFAVPKEFGEGETIHAGKGCLQHHEVDAAFFQGMERLPGGTGGKGPVAGIREEERERLVLNFYHRQRSESGTWDLLEKRITEHCG